jgi:hypothetical protein
VAVIDVLMPAMSGIECAQLLHTCIPREHPPPGWEVDRDVTLLEVPLPDRLAPGTTSAGGAAALSATAATAPAEADPSYETPDRSRAYSESSGDFADREQRLAVMEGARDLAFASRSRFHIVSKTERTRQSANSAVKRIPPLPAGFLVERTGIEPVTSGLQSHPIARPRLTPSDRMGMTESKLASTSDFARHRSTVVRSHGARTTAASGGNETSAGTRRPGADASKLAACWKACACRRSKVSLLCPSTCARDGSVCQPGCRRSSRSRASADADRRRQTR